MTILIDRYTGLGTRENNEDYMLSCEDGSRFFFALADGLGGLDLGELASKCACEIAIDELRHTRVLSNDMFGAIYSACQERIHDEQKKHNAAKGIRTTLNLLCLDKKAVYWSHIGDSRTYYFRNKAFVSRTIDHSVPQMLVAAGELEEKEIRFHEDRNRLLRVLGGDEEKPGFECKQPIPITGGQQFLLCTDGFWELISDEQILLCLDEADSPALWMENMKELIRRNGRNREQDNLTAIAVWIEERDK